MMKLIDYDWNIFDGNNHMETICTHHLHQVIREMEGTIQLKKYRTMRRRYGEGIDVAGETSRIGQSVNDMLK